MTDTSHLHAKPYRFSCYQRHFSPTVPRRRALIFSWISIQCWRQWRSCVRLPLIVATTIVKEIIPYVLVSSSRQGWCGHSTSTMWSKWGSSTVLYWDACVADCKAWVYLVGTSHIHPRNQKGSAHVRNILILVCNDCAFQHYQSICGSRRKEASPGTILSAKMLSRFIGLYTPVFSFLTVQGTMALKFVPIFDDFSRGNARYLKRHTKDRSRYFNKIHLSTFGNSIFKLTTHNTCKAGDYEGDALGIWAVTDEPRTWNWTELVGIDESPEQLAWKRPLLLGCVVQRGDTGDKAEEHFQRSACRRHRRQGRRNACWSWLVLKRLLLGCVVPRGDTWDNAEGTLSKKRLLETQKTRPMKRLLFLASVEAATVGMRRSKKRQGRRILSKKRLTKTQETRPTVRLLSLAVLPPSRRLLGGKRCSPGRSPTQWQKGAVMALAKNYLPRQTNRGTVTKILQNVEDETQDHHDGVLVSWFVNWLILRSVDFMEEMDATGSISQLAKRCYIVTTICNKRRRSQHKTSTMSFSKLVRQWILSKLRQLHVRN